MGIVLDDARLGYQAQEVAGVGQAAGRGKQWLLGRKKNRYQLTGRDVLLGGVGPFTQDKLTEGGSASTDPRGFVRSGGLSSRRERINKEMKENTTSVKGRECVCPWKRTKGGHQREQKKISREVENRDDSRPGEGDGKEMREGLGWRGQWSSQKYTERDLGLGSLKKRTATTHGSGCFTDGSFFF
jgi:hypothetical protein